MSTETRTFGTIEDFKVRKLEEDEKNKAHYVQRSSSIMHGLNKHWCLYCNRSGKARIKETEWKRQVKSQGSHKTGSCCIAHIKVIEDTVTGKIHVEYCSTHNVHSVEISHLQIPSNIKSKIASKLHQGVAMEKILDDVRDETLSTRIGCEQLLSRQNILNIQRQLDLGSISKYSNDHTSTCAWVEDLKSQSYNPVVIFKPQGVH